MERPGPQDLSRPSEFPSTQWSLVLAAGEGAESGSRRALAELCRAYWPPLYTFARRRGLTRDDAQDATQDFFIHLLEHDLVSRADPERGRFRSFLLSSLRNFLADRHHRASALKRGGGAVHLTLDAIAESEADIEGTAAAATPEVCFDATWARMLAQRALGVVRDSYEERGRGDVFLTLRSFLAGADAPSYGEAGARLGISEAAVTSAIHRLRQDYRAALRNLVAQTVRDVGDVDDELRHLLAALVQSPA